MQALRQLGKNYLKNKTLNELIERNKVVPALAPEERRRDRPEGHGRNRRLACAMNTK